MGGLVSGVYEVLIYDQKYATVWEMPVYSTVGVLIIVRLIVAYVLAQTTRNFGRGMKVTGPITYGDRPHHIR